MLTPSIGLLVKLGSIAVHAEEMMASDGIQIAYQSPAWFDQKALQTLLDAPEVQEWIQQMSRAAMLPVKRG